MKQELSELKHYQDLQIEQENQIKRLESNLEEMKFKHAKTTRDLKSKFLRDKETFRYVLPLFEFATNHKELNIFVFDEVLNVSS